jgi:hypothetical protein
VFAIKVFRGQIFSFARFEGEGRRVLVVDGRSISWGNFPQAGAFRLGILLNTFKKFHVFGPPAFGFKVKIGKAHVLRKLGRQGKGDSEPGRPRLLAEWRKREIGHGALVGGGEWPYLYD